MVVGNSKTALEGGDTMKRRRKPIEERFCYKGDAVRRKVGGPEMVVIGWDGGLVVCEWVEWEVLIQTGTYHVSELEMVRKA